MAIRRTQVGKEVTFTANITSTKLDYSGVLDHIAIGLNFQQDGTDAPTLATLLGRIDEILVRQGSVDMFDLRMEDAIALMALLFNQNFRYLISAGDGEFAFIYNIQIPCFYEKLSKDVTYQIAITDIATTDNEQITVEAVQANVAKLPPLRIKTFDYSADATSGKLPAVSDTLTGDLIAIMFYSTTIPTTTNLNSSIKNVEIELNGATQIQTSWETMGSDQKQAGTVQGDSILDGILDNYRLLSLVDDPFPRGSTLKVLISADATDASRVILIEALQVKAKEAE